MFWVKISKFKLPFLDMCLLYTKGKACAWCIVSFIRTQTFYLVAPCFFPRAPYKIAQNGIHNVKTRLFHCCLSFSHKHAHHRNIYQREEEVGSFPYQTVCFPVVRSEALARRTANTMPKLDVYHIVYHIRKTIDSHT